MAKLSLRPIGQIARAVGQTRWSGCQSYRLGRWVWSPSYRFGQSVGSPSYRLGPWVESSRLSSCSVGQIAKAIALVGRLSYRAITSVREAGHQGYRLGWPVGVSLSLSSLVVGSGHGITMVRSTLVGSPIKELDCSGSVRWEEPTSSGRRKILWSGQHPGWVMAASGWSDNIVIGLGDRIATSISWYKVDSEKSRKRLSRCAGVKSAVDRPSEMENRKSKEIALGSNR